MRKKVPVRKAEEGLCVFAGLSEPDTSVKKNTGRPAPDGYPVGGRGVCSRSVGASRLHMSPTLVTCRCPAAYDNTVLETVLKLNTVSENKWGFSPQPYNDDCDWIEEETKSV